MRLSTLRPLVVAAAIAAAGCATAPGSLELASASSAADVAATSRLGDLALEAREYQEASEAFARALQARPDDARAWLGFGEAELGLGHAKRAADAFGRAAADPGLRPRALQGLGLAALGNGDVDRAMAHLGEAAAADPGLWRAWNGLGRAHDQRRDYAAAAEAYRKALQHAEDPARVHNNLGFSLLAQGLAYDAEDEFGRALELDPSLAVARANLRLALASQGRYQEAVAGLDGAAQAEAFNNAGYIAMMHGDLEIAETLFTRALEASPSLYEPAWRNLQQLRDLHGSPDFDV